MEDQGRHIHNTIHILVPSQAGTQAAGTGGGASATLINPRIGCRHHACRLPDDGNENNETLDQGYGFTSPMTNIEPKVDTLLCRTFNTYQQRLGGSVVVMKKTLVTDPARISAAARTALVQNISASTHINFVEVGKLEIWDIELPQGSLDDW